MSTGFLSFIAWSMAILHMEEEKDREICSDFIILILRISASSRVYRLLGGSWGITIFETSCSLFRAQDAISMRHNIIFPGGSACTSVGTHCPCLPYKS